MLFIDWLQISYYTSENQILNFDFEVADIYTRQFTKIVNYYENKVKLFSAVFAPHDGSILKTDFRMLKFENHLFYSEKGMKIIFDVLGFLNMKYKKINISRIDIAYDFQKIGLLSGQYIINSFAKMRWKPKRLKTLRVDAKNHQYETVRLGSLNADISYKIYNKTKELEVSGKQYIKDLHKETFKNKLDVYRFEVVLKRPNDRAIIDKETGEYYNVAIEFLENKRTLEELAQVLSIKYKNSIGTEKVLKPENIVAVYHQRINDKINDQSAKRTISANYKIYQQIESQRDRAVYYQIVKNYAENNNVVSYFFYKFGLLNNSISSKN